MALTNVLERHQDPAGTTDAGVLSPNPTVGHHLIAVIARWVTTTRTITSVADDKGNTWQRDRQVYDPTSNNVVVEIWSARVDTGGTVTVTVTMDSSGGHIDWVVGEADDLTKYNWVDQVGSASAHSIGSNGTITVTAGGATLQPHQLVVAGLTFDVDNTSFADPASSGYSSLMASSAFGSASYKNIDANETSSAAWSYTINSGNFYGYGAALVTYRRKGDYAIWELYPLTSPTTDDLLLAVDSPGASPVTKKLAISDLISTLLWTNVTVQTKTTTGSGTYTPTAGMKKCLVIAVGGGGTGGGGVNTDSTGGGGGGGGTCIKLFTSADVGASKPFVVGAAATDTTWNTTTLVASKGANGSAGTTTTTIGTFTAGGAGGAATGGDINIPGMPGMPGVTFDTTNGYGGAGGDSAFGKGGKMSGSNTAGNAGTNYGGGGGGGHASGTSDRVGASGAQGVIYIIEFLAA